MADVATTMAKKKKKKGRPSLLDIQKRSLKKQHDDDHHQQQQQIQVKSNFKNPNSLNLTPVSNRRSTRRNPNKDGGTSSNSGLVDDEDEDERKEKKHKLLHGLNPHNSSQHFAVSPDPNSTPNGSDRNLDSGGDNLKGHLKRQKISAVDNGSDETGEKFLKATESVHGSPVESGPTTPLPDKKLLVFILDRLQKKDTYGVFSEPVDPEELPDYHEMIQSPMDFATLREKLEGGAYANLEQFENDVFLICSNAMQYNSPDTVYFRQARSIQEIAKKDFETLRQESDDSEPQPKVVRRGRPPGKSTKKLANPSSFDRIASEFSSDATLATGGDAANLSNGYNLRRGSSSYKVRPTDTVGRTSYATHNGETCNNWSSEWENEFPASVVKAAMKYGKKHVSVDENRRDSYYQSLASANEPPVLSSIEGESKQLTPVGLSIEHGYARSLARFAADLGPVAWKIASKKIESVLPAGVKFGPGWVGENGTSEQQQSPFFQSENQKYSNNPFTNDDRVLSPATSVSNTVVGSRCSEDMNVMRISYPPENDLTSSNCLKAVSSDRNGFNHLPQIGSVRPVTPPLPQMIGGICSNGSRSTISPLPFNGFDSNEPNLGDGSSRLNFRNPNGFGSLTVNEGVDGKSSPQELALANMRNDFRPFPPDLNVRFLAPASPSSSLRIGSPQQPDLALQL